MKELITKPEATAVSLADVKGQIRIESTFTAQDGLLTSYINAAVGQVEGITGRKLITQTWALSINPVIYPAITVLLPFGPAQSISSVVWKTEDGAEEPVDPADYELIRVTDDRSAVRFSDEFSFPDDGYHTDPLTITFVTGYGDTPDDIPAEIKLALLLAVSHFYTNGLPTLSEDAEKAIYSLVDEHRLRRAWYE